MICLPRLYSDGPRHSLVIGPDRDFNAATDSQLNLAVARSITRSLPVSTTFVDTH